MTGKENPPSSSHGLWDEATFSLLGVLGGAVLGALLEKLLQPLPPWLLIAAFAILLVLSLITVALQRRTENSIYGRLLWVILLLIGLVLGMLLMGILWSEQSIPVPSSVPCPLAVGTLPELSPVIKGNVARLRELSNGAKITYPDSGAVGTAQ